MHENRFRQVQLLALPLSLLPAWLSAHGNERRAKAAETNPAVVEVVAGKIVDVRPRSPAADPSGK